MARLRTVALLACIVMASILCIYAEDAKVEDPASDALPKSEADAATSETEKSEGAKAPEEPAAAAADAPKTPEELFGKPIKKLRVKELQKALDERGVECKGCSEKDHLVQKLEEVWQLPVKAKEAPLPPPPPAAASSESSSSASSASSSSSGTEKIDPVSTSDLTADQLEDIIKSFTAEDDKKRQVHEQLRKLGINVPDPTPDKGGIDWSKLKDQVKQKRKKEGKPGKAKKKEPKAEAKKDDKDEL